MQDVKFSTCYFNGRGPDAGTGIQGMQSSFTVSEGGDDPNFQNLSIGVEAMGYAGGLTNSINISECLFDNVTQSINLRGTQNLDFSKSYGNLGYDDARSLVATKDGGYVFTGLNKSIADSEGDMYLTKVNAAGVVLWEQFYGLPKEDGGNAVINTQDGGFLISGHILKIN